MTTLDALPELLAAAERDRPLKWQSHDGMMMYVDKELRLGLVLMRYPHGLLSKKLKTELHVFYDGRQVRKYRGEAVNDLYALAWLHQGTANALSASALEASATKALEHLLS